MFPKITYIITCNFIVYNQPSIKLMLQRRVTDVYGLLMFQQNLTNHTWGGRKFHPWAGFHKKSGKFIETP